MRELQTCFSQSQARLAINPPKEPVSAYQRRTAQGEGNVYAALQAKSHKRAGTSLSKETLDQGAQCCKRKCQKLKCTLLRLVLGTNQGCLADKSSNAQSRTWHARYHLTIGAIRLACSLEDSDMSSRSTSFQLILRSQVPCLSG